MHIVQDKRTVVLCLRSRVMALSFAHYSCGFAKLPKGDRTRGGCTAPRSIILLIS